jgi:hypothetical protein
VLVILLQLKNAPPLMMVTLVGMFNVPNVVQFSNALVPIDNKLPPSATAGILLQPSNALVPIDWIFPAIVSVLVIFLQPLNAVSLMELTLGGIFNVPNVVQFWNARKPIDCNGLTNATPGILEQFKNVSVPINATLPAIVSALVILLQSSNTDVPMAVTELGILIVPIDVQSLNALVLMKFKLPPSATAWILGQFKKACVPIV